ncbi:MAG: hypothetical protein K8J08_14870 [Thermoanaerobaculia bacterium]|nr:hypothetical protein [Thermoanaerobaculia bacterium]
MISPRFEGGLGSTERTRPHGGLVGVLRWLVIPLLFAGCVSKSDHQTVLTQLEECRVDKGSAQAAAASCEERFDREIARFDSMDSTLSDVLPATLKEFEGERERILELVPVQVQEEVASYMENFSQAVGRGFQNIERDNERMMTELTVARSQLESLGVSSEDLGRRVQSINAGLSQQNALRADAAGISDALREFDETMVLCKDCEGRLRLNRKEREAIALFHADIIARLNRLATGEVAPAADETVTPTDVHDGSTDAATDEDT